MRFDSHTALHKLRGHPPGAQLPPNFILFDFPSIAAGVGMAPGAPKSYAGIVHGLRHHPPKVGKRVRVPLPAPATRQSSYWVLFDQTAGKARQHAENQKPKLWTRAGTEPRPGWGNTTPPLHTGGAYAGAAWDFQPGSRAKPCGRLPNQNEKE